MERRIKIKTEGLEVQAYLNDCRIATLIWEALPLKSTINTWGEEIYFTIPVKASIDNPREVVEKGDLAYWPDGPAFCIFFGHTPLSRGEEIRPASAVEVVGRVAGNPEEFKKVEAGKKIVLEPLA